MMMKSLGIAIWILVVVTGTATGQNARMGLRYQLIDAEVESVTTGFKEVEVTTSRTTDGTRETQVRMNDGRLIGTPLIVTPEQMRLVAGSDRPVGAPAAINVDVQSLDSVNADRYLAWRDGQLSSRKPFEKTPDELIGTQGPVEISHAADDILWVRSSSRGLEAFSRIGRSGLLDGRELPAFTSVLREEEEVLATMAWFPRAQVLVFQTAWRPEPLYFGAKDLPNGWTFTPNMAWANIQLLSFAKSAGWQENRKNSQSSQEIGQNSPGCDLLHWLDGTVFRECCDNHDLCYYAEDPNCTFHSWWFQGSWSCVQCNIEAIYCFSAIALNCMFPEDNFCVLYQIYDWGPNWPPNCYIYFGCVCPAWCYGCASIYGSGPCP